MMLPRFRIALVALAMLLLAACGFHLRREAVLPASMQRMYIDIADANGALARDLARALPRSGVRVEAAPGPGVAVLAVTADSLDSDVLSIGSAARASEYSLRRRVEFAVRDGSGAALVPLQVIELSRDFTFDAADARGVGAETDLLARELERDMVQAILRRLEAAAGQAGRASDG